MPEIMQFRQTHIEAALELWVTTEHIDTSV